LADQRTPSEWIYDSDTPLKFKGVLKDGRLKEFLLLPSKDKSYWQFVNITSGHICLCKFATKEKALEDFVNNYSGKYENVIFSKLLK